MVAMVEEGSVPPSGSRPYLQTQCLLIVSDEHRLNTKHALQVNLGCALGREPTLDECGLHWLKSGANVRFREHWIKGEASRLMRQVGLLGQVI
jgi:hypothetical protein